MTVGYRVFVCDNMAFQGDFSPVLAKHTKRFSLIDAVSVGVDRMQRNFEPMRHQIEIWKESRIQDEEAKLVIYQAFVEEELEAPKHLARRVHDLYFNPQFEEFAPRTRWSLANAFTSAFKELDPIPQFKATAKLAPFLESRAASSYSDPKPLNTASLTSSFKTKNLRATRDLALVVASIHGGIANDQGQHDCSFAGGGKESRLGPLRHSRMLPDESIRRCREI